MGGLILVATCSPPRKLTHRQMMSLSLRDIAKVLIVRHLPDLQLSLPQVKLDLLLFKSWGFAIHGHEEYLGRARFGGGCYLQELTRRLRECLLALNMQSPNPTAEARIKVGYALQS